MNIKARVEGEGRGDGGMAHWDGGQEAGRLLGGLGFRGTKNGPQTHSPLLGCQFAALMRASAARWGMAF